MDFPNAFIGTKTQPSATEVAAKLGPSATVWNKLTAWLREKGIACEEWKSVSPKYGWSLRPKLKTRIILYMGPCDGRFRVSLVLGDRALAAARASDLPKSLLKEISEAHRYAEGTGIRMMIKTTEDLGPVRKLVEIKLRN